VGATPHGSETVHRRTRSPDSTHSRCSTLSSSDRQHKSGVDFVGLIHPQGAILPIAEGRSVLITHDV
jgi:hypothetical protein